MLKKNTMADNRSLIVFALFGLSLVASPCAKAELAQTGSPAPAPAVAAPPQAKPATQAQVSTYMTMGAVNMCLLSELKQPFKDALSVNVEMVSFIMATEHGSQVIGVPNKLTQEQLVNGAVIEIIPRVKAGCKNLSPEWTKSVDTMLSDIRKQLGAAPPKK